MTEPTYEMLPQVLLPWYAENHRSLPWRQDRLPYHVWLSEIMLQQTRVEAVRAYYVRFLQQLPTIEALAECEEDALLKLWEGLGYYSRVRNLQKAARVILAEHGGEFPRDYRAVRSLPGIGDYTAGAICSICFEMPTPAVDGNVLRVVSRIWADEEPIDLPAHKERVRQALEKVYPAGQCGAFTQALMELGATVCVPNGQPHCDCCPCAAFCLASQQGRTTELPVKLGKKPRRMEELTVFVLLAADQVALQKRPDTGLLAKLWQFPNVPGKLELPQAMEQAEAYGLRVRNVLRQTERKHIFTHVQWNMRCYYLELFEPAGDFVWMERSMAEKHAALPTAFRQFWEETIDV